MSLKVLKMFMVFKLTINLQWVTKHKVLCTKRPYYYTIVMKMVLKNNTGTEITKLYEKWSVI